MGICVIRLAMDAVLAFPWAKAAADQHICTCWMPRSEHIGSLMPHIYAHQGRAGHRRLLMGHVS